MKLLHTGDLHLGKNFYERSLMEDQRDMLEQLTRELVSGGETASKTTAPYQALIVAGDVYDRAVPPPEAVELFSGFLTGLRHQLPDLHVIIIPGNHDSARRLSFAAALLKHQNIHIAATADDLLKPIVIDGAAIYTLPFLNPNFFEDGQIHQQPMVQTAVEKIAAHHREHHPQLAKILAGHLFTQGGTSSDSERIFVGTAESVDASLFADFAYVALGHLHRCQNPAVPGRAPSPLWYSGSPLAYSFSEAGNDNSFLRVELEPTDSTVELESIAPETDSTVESEPTNKCTATTKVSVTKIPVVPLHPVRRLTGNFEDFYRDTEGKYEEYRDSYLEISATDPSITENPMSLLRHRFPLLLSFRQDVATASTGSATMEQRRQLIQQEGQGDGPNKKIFRAFMEDIYQELPPEFPQEEEIFQSLLERIYASQRDEAVPVIADVSPSPQIPSKSPELFQEAEA